MAQVEAQKRKCLDQMVDKVSEAFGTLLSFCLPGVSCWLVKLREGEKGMSREDRPTPLSSDPSMPPLTGVRVRVAFQGKAKESLVELSGGQRSLLALCLLLAILRFRPAPLYILDEIDAALDPIHTEKMGAMLQKHFPEAQFLLISLKEGMFSHANVLFEVKNPQGFSEVVRKSRGKMDREVETY